MESLSTQVSTRVCGECQCLVPTRRDGRAARHWGRVPSYRAAALILDFEEAGHALREALAGRSRIYCPGSGMSPAMLRQLREIEIEIAAERRGWRSWRV